jgi:anti-sigma-K factor RskA
MTSVDNNEPERGSDDIIAAEYVLGVLPAAERTAATRRIDLEAAFARLVEQWEGYFSPLNVAYQAVEPPASVKVALDRRLFAIGGAAPSAPPQPSLWSSLALWRGLAAAAIAAFAIYIALPFINPPVSVPQTRLVASIAPADSDVSYLAVYDAAAGEVSLSRVSGDPGTGDFELWMVEGQNAPVSMGVIPAGETARIAVTPETKAKLDKGVALAISLEPKGGSPNGAPTKVVAAGGLTNI